MMAGEDSDDMSGPTLFHECSTDGTMWDALTGKLTRYVLLESRVTKFGGRDPKKAKTEGMSVDVDENKRSKFVTLVFLSMFMKIRALSKS